MRCMIGVAAAESVNPPPAGGASVGAGADTGRLETIEFVAGRLLRTSAGRFVGGFGAADGVENFKLRPAEAGRPMDMGFCDIDMPLMGGGPPS